MELAVYMQDSCNFIIPTFFSSKIDSFSEGKIHFNYNFLVEIDSECDIESNEKDTLLLDSTTISYQWNESSKQFHPNWASLNKFDSIQFFSLTNWSTLEGFTKDFERYSKENKKRKPKTVAFIESTFID